MAARGLVLALCTTGSVALHLGLLTVSTAGPPGSAGIGPGAGLGRTASVQVRAVPLSAPTAPTAPTPLTASTAPSDATQPTASESAPASVPASASAPPSPAAAPALTAVADGLDPEQWPPTGAGPVDAADQAYWPRSLLTRPPAPQQSIDLLYPALAPSGRFRAVLTLFIDEQGVVQRVRIDEADDSGLPPVLEDAARQTFLRSSFTPGEIDGRPIRSRLRIEVEYATESLQDSPQDTPR